MQYLQIYNDNRIVLYSKNIGLRQIDLVMIQKYVNYKLPLNITFLTNILDVAILDIIQNYKGKHLKIEFSMNEIINILDVCKKNTHIKKLILTYKPCLELWEYLDFYNKHIAMQFERMFYELVLLQPNLYIVKLQQYGFGCNILCNCDKINNILVIRSYNKKIRNSNFIDLLLA